jgi:hypothetical protein
MLIYSPKKFINPTAAQFFAKVRALNGDVFDKKGINDFCNGMDSILPPQTWVAWPLRSTQSIGSGIIVPSLGGLGNYNGISTNNPQWDYNGMNFLAPSFQNVNTPLVFSNTRWALLSVFYFTGTGYNYESPISFFNQGYSLGKNASISTQCGVQNPGSAPPTGLQTIVNNTFSMISASFPTTLSFETYKNGTNQIASTWEPNLVGANTLHFGQHTASANNYFMTGKIAFNMAVRAAINPHSHAMIYSLYKQTLGQDLGLS